MRKALVVGINYYENISPLFGCVNDAHSVKEVLERNADGGVNFGVRLEVCSSAGQSLERSHLKGLVADLFSGDSDIALFYFAGHGHIEDTGGYLCASDCKTGDDGLALSELMTLANRSRAKNKIIVLDSCHSGIAGNRTVDEQVAELKDGMTIMTASTEEQYASEAKGSGIFTSLFTDALYGAAANLLGDVTPGSVYAHVDQSLGPWSQRPVFKTNVRSFVSLRKTIPPLSQQDLLRITEFFPCAGFEYSLDPSYEPERAPGDEKKEDYISPNKENTAIFRILQQFNRVNLVVPVGAPHMWHAAMQSKACKLTVLGEHYRQLVDDGLI